MTLARKAGLALRETITDHRWLASDDVLVRLIALARQTGANDAARLDWLIDHHAYVGERIPMTSIAPLSKEYFVIEDPYNRNVRHRAAESPRAAIDAALAGGEKPLP